MRIVEALLTVVEESKWEGTAVVGESMRVVLVAEEDMLEEGRSRQSGRGLETWTEQYIFFQLLGKLASLGLEVELLVKWLQAVAVPPSGVM